jgi:hypothetical protein
LNITPILKGFTLKGSQPCKGSFSETLKKILDKLERTLILITHKIYCSLIGDFLGNFIVRGSASKGSEWVYQQPNMRGKTELKRKPKAGCVQAYWACVCPYFFTYI